MKLKKFIAIVLLCSAFFTSQPIYALANHLGGIIKINDGDGLQSITKVDKWDGQSEDSSWYNDSKTEFTLESAAQLAVLASLVVKLGTSVDWCGYEWTAVGIKDNPFKGVFDGCHNTICNLNIIGAEPSVSNTQYIGLFGYVDNATIMQLGLSECKIDTTYSSNSVAHLHERGEWNHFTYRDKKGAVLILMCRFQFALMLIF